MVNTQRIMIQLASRTSAERSDAPLRVSGLVVAAMNSISA